MLQIQAFGAPLGGANVTFTVTSGVMSPASGVTDSTGQFTSDFVPEQNGVAIITAVVSSPFLGNQTTGTNILVAPPGGVGIGGTGTSRGLGALGSLLPIILVVVVIVIVALGARRIVKSRRTSQDEAEEKEPGEK
jgi:hypothetical protein